MMTFGNKLISSKQVYQSRPEDTALRAWPLKKTMCKIYLYEDEPCSDMDTIICSTLYKHHNRLPADGLATILGFNVKDDFNVQPHRYKDEAELGIFNQLLNSIEKDELIRREANDIVLTSLGEFAVLNAKKRKFYEAECRLLENVRLLSNDETAFPFRDALSITTPIQQMQPVAYYKTLTSYGIEPQVISQEKALVDTLQLQMEKGIKLFSAALVPHMFLFESEMLDITIGNEHGDDFVVVYAKDGRVSEYASELLNHAINKKIKDIKVEWGYYLRLLNDSTAQLNYENLKPFEDIIEWGRVIHDNRFCWSEKPLFKMLSENIDANVWSDVSALCPIKEIKTYLTEYLNDLDWNVLSARMDGAYITEHASQYPWNFDIVIHNEQVGRSDLEQLLANPTLTSVPWFWEDIMPSLSDEFIIKHIDDISFDLSLMTEQEPELVKSLLLDYPDKNWNWTYITQSYDLGYIFKNIDLLSRRLDVRSLMIRALSSEEYATLFCQSATFTQVLQDTVAVSSVSFNVNALKLVWSKTVIDFLDEHGLLSWCVPVIGGFEANPYIEWDKDFFESYAKKIYTDEGYACVSSRVKDATIVNDHPEFAWDWEIVSSKKEWMNDLGFVRKHIALLNLETAFALFSSNTFCALFECPEVQQFLQAHPESQAKATELASMELVKEHFGFDWDWKLLTSKSVDKLKIEKLGDKRWVNKWDWDVLSEQLSIEQIADHLVGYQDYWNWSILTRRLDKATIRKHLVDCANHWDWMTLVDSIFSKQDLGIKGLLPSIASLIVCWDDESKHLLWQKITRRFSLVELYGLVHQTRLVNFSHLFQWDLLYIYDHPDFNLNEYIKSYPEDVDWSVLSQSKSVARLFLYDKSILSFTRWLGMVNSLLTNDLFHWDFHALSRNNEINWHPAVLKTYKKRWDWQYLSIHSTWFSDDGTSQSRTQLHKNLRQFQDALNFGLLSSRSDITFDDSLLKKFNAEAWDWKAISASEKLAIKEDFLIDNQDKEWDWEVLSQGHKLNITHKLLEQTKHQAWNWELLSANDSLKITLAELLSLNIMQWDWKVLSGRWDIKFDNESLLSTLDNPQITWDWYLLSARPDLIFNEDLILTIWQKPVDWECISRMSSFVPSAKVLSRISSNGLDWSAVSQNEYLTPEVLSQYRDRLDWHVVSQRDSFREQGVAFFCQYKEYLDWTIISNAREFTLSMENLNEFKDYLDWTVINRRSDLEYTNELLDTFPNYINWSNASKATTLQFSIEFVKKHIDRWDWPVLMKNPLIIQDKNNYTSVFKDKINGIKFLERFSDSNPKVYHFAHLFNAVGIIRSRKILSRIGGKGLFENSAGSNVYRRDTAHHYARFYYRPQTPTQYYNEALGEDSHSSTTKQMFVGYDTRGKMKYKSWVECPTKKYKGAQRLGFPKCPMPVFFEFELQEILNSCLDKCYYSTGNMQKDASQVISIVNTPDRLNTQFLYSSISDGQEIYKAYSQQEFLVLDELDFSSFKNLRIICYNEEQAKLLKQQLGDDPICDYITTDSQTSSGISVFHRTNKTVSISETQDVISFSTDYLDQSAIVIESENTQRIDVIEKTNIINITPNTIYAYPSISFHKPAFHVTVRFTDLHENNRNSWIIYSNEPQMIASTRTYRIISKQLLEQFETETSKLQIKISKSLFKKHMLHSHHGIAHTVRVMWNAFMIASLEAVTQSTLHLTLQAALIHDLGKQNDTEGEIHGQNSARLYEDEIQKLFTPQDASALLVAVQYHSVDDSKTPENVKSNKIWEILKDADALDRSRFPSGWCNPIFLRNNLFHTESGKELLLLAKELPSLTKECTWDEPVSDLVSAIKSII